jgi:hypothetical protein
MSSVPPPPVSGPLTIAPSNAAPPGYSLIRLWFWSTLELQWVNQQLLQIGWDKWPFGYYATSKNAADGLADWGEHSQVIVVVSRTQPDGTAAPYVLQQPPSGESQSLDCPPGTWLTDVGNQFGDPGPLCALIGQPGESSCPPGTVWDPQTETCVAITVPPLPIVPAPPPPPSEPQPPFGPLPVPGQPEEDGDEITYTLCTQLWAQTTAIVDAIQQLQIQQGDGGGSSTSCCANVVTAIGGITQVLSLIFNLLPTLGGSGSPPADPVTCAQLTVLFGQLINGLSSAAAEISTAIGSNHPEGPDPNVKRIADVINGFDPDDAAAVATFKEYVQTAVKNYGFPADLAQLLTS